MYTYWDNRPAVFMTFTDKYIRILVGGRKHHYAGIIQEIIEDPSDTELLTEQVSRLVTEHKLKGFPALFSYADHDLLLRSTIIPIDIPEDEWKGHLYMELGESFHLPFKNPIIEIVGDRLLEERQEVIALAVPESDVLRYEQIMKAAKLNPVAIDVPFLSLYRYFGEHFSIEEDSHVLLLHVELDQVQISMFHAHKPLYVRSLSLPDLEQYTAFETESGFQYVTVNPESPNLDEHLSIVRNEVNRLRTFYQYNLQGGSKEIDTVCIAGDHPLMDQFIDSLEEQETLKVFHSNEEVYMTKNGLAIPPSFTELIGLSWK